jgi:asparagine synthase (glutamine-hydrolysing)
VHGLEKPSSDRAHFIALSKRLRHRGPDWSGCYVGKQSVLVHERLAIVGVGTCRPSLFWLGPASYYLQLPDTGAQPLISQDGQLILAVNGEIYNYIALRSSFGPDTKLKTHSDCEVILPLVRFFVDLIYLCLMIFVRVVPETRQGSVWPFRWHVLFHSLGRIGRTSSTYCRS